MYNQELAEESSPNRLDKLIVKIGHYHWLARLLIAAALLLAVVIFVMVMVALIRQSKEAQSESSVRHHTGQIQDMVFGQGIAPVLPPGYKVFGKEHLSTVIVLGDSSASGHGVESRDTNSWPAVLSGLLAGRLGKWAPQVINLARDYTAIDDISAQIYSLRTARFPNGMPGRVAILVQSGAEDVITSGNGSAAALQLVQRVLQELSNSTAAALFLDYPPQLYFFDYPDCTSGTGYLAAGQLPCSIAGGPSFAQFSLFSVAASVQAQLSGVAAMPLRYVLARHGAQRQVVLQHSDSSLIRRDVLGGELGFPAQSVFSDCFFLSSAGQLFQAQLALAHLLGINYFQAW